MRKRLFSLLLLVLLFAAFSCSASAESSLPYVTDMAGILSSSEVQALEASAAQISEEYNCGLYIIVLDDFRKYSYKYDVYDAAQEIYQQYNLGLGYERNGMLLLLSMNERDFAVAAYGNSAHTAFTDYGKELVINSFLPELGNNFWYAGLNDYLTTSASLLKSAAEGNPVDVPETELCFGAKLGIVLLLPAIIALCVCGVFKAQMKTAKLQNFASEYVDESSFKLDINKDVYINRTVVTTPIPKSEPNHNGGGTTINSAGFSGRGGKF